MRAPARISSATRTRSHERRPSWLALLAWIALGCGSGCTPATVPVPDEAMPRQAALSQAGADDASALAELRRTIEMTSAAASVLDNIERDQLATLLGDARAAVAQLEHACFGDGGAGATRGPCMEGPPSRDAARSLGTSLDALAMLVGRVGRGRIVDPGDPNDPDNPCNPTTLCPHLGGDTHHNWCADTEPPNVHPGCDVVVSFKAFDALSPDGALWEIKTDAWSNYSLFLKDVTLAAHRISARVEHRLALSCSFPYVFAVADAELYQALEDYMRGQNIDLRHLPRCVR